MAVGATLTAADKVVFNDLPWNAADLRQAEDRCHRGGQKNNVDLLKRKEEIMPIDEPDKKVPIAQEEQEEKEDNWKEKDSKSKNEAPKGSIDNPLPALPKDTDLVLKPSTFSSWDGKLAIVEGPSY